MRVNGIAITHETILKTREHFADNARACINDVRSGTLRPNNPERYIAEEQSLIADILDGKSDHTLTFVQRALWIQTGECPPLLGGER